MGFVYAALIAALAAVVVARCKRLRFPAALYLGLAAIILSVGLYAAVSYLNREQGSFDQIILSEYEHAVFDRATVIDYYHEPSYRMVQNEEFDELFAYLRNLSLTAVLPWQRHDLTEKDLSLTVYGSNPGQGAAPPRAAIRIALLDRQGETLLGVRSDDEHSSKGQAIYRPAEEFDEEMLYRLLNRADTQ